MDISVPCIVSGLCCKTSTHIRNNLVIAGQFQEEIDIIDNSEVFDSEFSHLVSVFPKKLESRTNLKPSIDLNSLN